LAGAPPQTIAGGAYSAPPDLLAGLRGPTSKWREEEGGEGNGREGRRERKGTGREKGRQDPTPSRPP